MAVETADDLAIYFDPRDFGGLYLYAPRDGSTPYDVAGLFDEPNETFDPNQWQAGNLYQQREPPPFSGTAPTIRCRTGDLVAGGRRGDKFTVDSRALFVADVKPDGSGSTILVLTDDNVLG